MKMGGYLSNLAYLILHRKQSPEHIIVRLLGSNLLVTKFKLCVYVAVFFEYVLVRNFALETGDFCQKVVNLNCLLFPFFLLFVDMYVFDCI